MHASHFARELIAVPHIGQEIAGIGMGRKSLFQKKKFTLIVVQSNQFSNLIVFQQLSHQLPSDSATSTSK
jgi:hypothetical protein